jgi:hypothetical protein
MARLALLKSDSELTARNVASIVNAFARAGIWDERIFKRMSASLRRMPKDGIELRDIARIVHAFSLAQVKTMKKFLRDEFICIYLKPSIKV